MTNNPNLLTFDEKLKAALYHSVSKICKSTAANNTIIGPYSFHKDAIELITEIVYKKLEIYSDDLVAFAKNRKQSTINVEDVKLLTRRNPKMKEHITKYANELAANKVEKKKKGKTVSKTEPSTSTTSNNVVIDID